jgi:hypothetical protein
VACAVEMLERQPFGGPLAIRFGDRRHTIGGQLAAAMRMERDWPAPGDRPQHSRNMPQLPPRTDSETTTTPAQEAGYP